jgi:dihydrofolate reductase
MSKVFVDVGVSLDGYMAGTNRGPGNPLGDRGVSIHRWAFECAYFRERIGSSGGLRSHDDSLIREVFERAGAYVMGRRMFDEGEAGWPENAPFRAPVFVLTNTPREPWPRKGGTTFYFVTDGIVSALEHARAVAGEKDVRVAGGAATIGEYIKAGRVDELTLHIAPTLLGDGLRLLNHLGPADLELTQLEASHSPLVTHVRYKVARRSAQTR